MTLLLVPPEACEIVAFDITGFPEEADPELFGLAVVGVVILGVVALGLNVARLDAFAMVALGLVEPGVKGSLTRCEFSKGMRYASWDTHDMEVLTEADDVVKEVPGAVSNSVEDVTAEIELGAAPIENVEEPPKLCRGLL